ncbi:MAG TPA: hypothetical protein VGE38_07175 [Nocardioides sp.]|uniref:hypothetical protein n=1 Tax=Nocardioides sp. TaxID=35761 RepID=UPI002ED9194F
MSDNPFGNPDGHDHDHGEHDPGAHRPLSSGLLSVEDVLAAARLPERTATICVRADLTAEHDAIMAEMATLVTPGGELLADDDEAAVSDQSNAARARELADRDRRVLDEMRANLWRVRFRAIDSDEWPEYKKKHMPKGKDVDLKDFRTKLIADCAIEPPITEDQVRALRKKFGSGQIDKLSDTAFQACEQGGVDVPKSPSSWANLAQK